MCRCRLSGQYVGRCSSQGVGSLDGRRRSPGREWNEESPAVAGGAPVVPIGELRPYPANSAYSASIIVSQSPTAAWSFISHSSPYLSTNQSFMPAVASWNIAFSSGVGT